MGVLAFTVGIVVRNVGGNTQARLGDGQSISADQLLTLVIRALHGRRIGDASWNIRRAEYLEPVDVFEAAGLTVVGVSVESTPMALPDDPEELDGLGDLRHVHLDMDIAPHASREEREKWLAEPPITPPTGLTCRQTFRWLAPAPKTDIKDPECRPSPSNPPSLMASRSRSANPRAAICRAGRAHRADHLLAPTPR